MEENEKFVEYNGHYIFILYDEFCGTNRYSTCNWTFLVTDLNREGKLERQNSQWRPNTNLN